MLDLKDKIINNSRPIRIPIYGDKIGIAEIPSMTVLCKKNPNVIIEVQKGNDRAMEVASIFKGMAKIVEIEKDNWDTNIDCYPKSDPRAHMSEIFLDTFAMESDDLIPYILLDNKELGDAFNLLTKYHDKPCIVFNPICGGAFNNDKIALIKMMQIKYWEEILEELSKKYNILYSGLSKKFLPVKHTIPVLDLNVRELASLISVCGKYVGVECGMAHLAVAAGAFCHVVVPNFTYVAADQHNGSLFANYAYLDEYWKYQPKRVIYHLFQDYRNLLYYL